MPVARIDRPTLPRALIAAPMPTTIPTYIAVMKAAREKYTNVLLMTTSIS